MSEIHDIYSTLAEIEQKLAHINAEIEVAGKRLGGSSSGGASLQKQISALNGAILMVNAYAGSSDLNGAIRKIEHLYVIMMAMNTIIATGKLALTSGLDPMAWLSLGTSVGGLGLNIASMTQSGGV